MSTGSSTMLNSPASLRTCSCSVTRSPLCDGRETRDARTNRLLASRSRASCLVPRACFLLPALAEPLRRVVHVVAHRRARAARVVARDRGHDVAVLLDGEVPQLRRVEVVLQAQEERPGALVPECLHDERQGAIAARFRDAQVEEPVGGKRHRTLVAVGLHLVERVFHGADLPPAPPPPPHPPPFPPYTSPPLATL